MRVSKNIISTVTKVGICFIASLMVTVATTSSLVPVYAYTLSPDYVAFGDSLTTGSSVATCRENRRQSPWGCNEDRLAAVPYPDRVAVAIQKSFSDRPRDYRNNNVRRLGLYRAGIWGYTMHEAAQAGVAGHNTVGEWPTQLQMIGQARQLVTGSLGVNDMQFSNIAKWVKLYLKPGGDHVTPEARRIIRQRSSDFDALMGAFGQAQEHGARVIVGLYYNPYDTNNKQCRDLKVIANRIVNTLDAELINRSRIYNFSVADFRPAFQGHGAGSKNPYVFGDQCKIGSALTDFMPTWMGGGGGKKALQVGFDPHPNNSGTLAMANLILQEYNGVD